MRWPFRIEWDFLTPDAGEGWFRSPAGDWVEVDAESWPGITEALAKLLAVWQRARGEDQATFAALRQHGCTLFVDAARFRTCVEDTSGLPGTFYVSLDVDWSFNASAGGIVLTPHFRATNRWPADGHWAPERPVKPQASVWAEQVAEVLEQGLWLRVETELRRVKERLGLHAALLDLGSGPQQPPVFYYVSPTRRPVEAEAYLEGPLRDALDRLGQDLLGTPDMRSLEITGGVLEGCLAVFAHSNKVQSEYCLVLPLAGVDEPTLERKLRFVTYHWSDIDLDATWEIHDITTDLNAERQFFSLWAGSLDMSMTLHEELSTLLPKPAIQERMFALAHLLTGFLVKLQARAYAGARTRRQHQRSLEWSIRASRNHAQRLFTIRPIRGVQLLDSVSRGFTRAFRAYEETIGRAAEQADRLSEQIESVNASLAYTASLEEQRKERAAAVTREREERGAKRLNLVLALVAVLAAIPLIAGQFSTADLSQALPWFPFGAGVYFSFWSALLAFAATLLAIVATLSRVRRPGRLPRSSPLRRLGEHADTLHDGYRRFGHRDVQRAIAELRSGSGQAEVAARVDRVDQELSRAVAAALDQAARWAGDAPAPSTDAGWARQAEERVCRFVLLSDVYDLRPERLALPRTLCLNRLHFAAGGLPTTPVSDWEWGLVMRVSGTGTPTTSWPPGPPPTRPGPCPPRSSSTPAPCAGWARRTAWRHDRPRRVGPPCAVNRGARELRLEREVDEDRAVVRAAGRRHTRPGDRDLRRDVGVVHPEGDPAEQAHRRPEAAAAGGPRVGEGVAQARVQRRVPGAVEVAGEHGRVPEAGHPLEEGRGLDTLRPERGLAVTPEPPEIAADELPPEAARADSVGHEVHGHQVHHVLPSLDLSEHVVPGVALDVAQPAPRQESPPLTPGAHGQAPVVRIASAVVVGVGAGEAQALRQVAHVGGGHLQEGEDVGLGGLHLRCDTGRGVPPVARPAPQAVDVPREHPQRLPLPCVRDHGPGAPPGHPAEAEDARQQPQEGALTREADPREPGEPG